MKKSVFVLLALSFWVSSCAPVYLPNARNAPLFRGAGEFQGSLHFGEGLDFQGAASVTDHLGFMANYNYTSRNSNNTSDYIQHNLWEGGIGYYENTGRICYEIFGGYGEGRGKTYDVYDFFGTNTVLATGWYNRFFFQPSFGINNKIFNWSVAARFSMVDFTRFENNGVLYTQPSDPFFFVEPAFIGKVNFGSTGIYTSFQAGMNYAFQGVPYFDYRPFHVSFGFGVRVGGKPKDIPTE